MLRETLMARVEITSVEREGSMSTATSSTSSANWAVMGIFVGAMLLPVAYVVAAVGGWIDWAAWMPVALSLGFTAWGAASRINRGT